MVFTATEWGSHEPEEMPGPEEFPEIFGNLSAGSEKLPEELPDPEEFPEIFSIPAEGSGNENRSCGTVLMNPER